MTNTTIASPDKKVTTFKTLGKIKLGTGPKTTAQFGKALEKANCQSNDDADYLLSGHNLRVSEIEQEVELVVVTPRELGHQDLVTSRGYVYRKAQKLGLSLCPMEVGPQIPLQISDYPHGKFLIVAMERLPLLPLHRDTKGVFNLSRCENGEQSLGVFEDSPECAADHDDLFVFIRK